MDIKEVITKARPNAKESTVKMYQSNLNKLQKMFDTDTWKFLDDIDAVKNKLSHLHYTSQRNYFNSIIILLMALNSDKKNDSEAGAHAKLIEQYNEIRDEGNKKYQDDNATGVISDKQKENFVELSEIQKMISEMDKEIKDKKLRTKETLKPKEKMLVQVFLLFNIYTRLPLRNDVASMSITTKRLYNKLSEAEKKENNYLVVEKNKMFFVLNQFKTSAKYKELDIDIPKDLEKILRFYIKVNGLKNGDVLFTSTTGTPLSRNALSQLFIKTSKKYLDKSISSTILRKIVLSDLFLENNKKQQKMAEIAGHSVATMNKVYIKDTDDMVSTE
jgi:integrase